ncbi:MAG: MFS transporter [Deltaproteobacteria bacterium]|nr:MFS transporter [Deltaproteobacteria bacterium]
MKVDPRFLAFSALHMFFSSPGQSFSFALFGPAFSAAFDLGAGGFGLLYSIATLISAGLLPIFGPIVDRVNLRICSILVGTLMAISMLTTSFATSVPVLFVGVLFLRFSGQGLMTQIGGVSATRFFGAGRGKALAIVGLGLSLGIATFPLALENLISTFGWEWTLIFLALLVLFLFLPCSMALLKKSDTFQLPPARVSEVEYGEKNAWNRKDVLKTPFFYFAVPIALLIPFFSTGLIIHIGSIALYKGWTMKWMASCFIISAISGRVGSFFMGPFVDRFTAKKLFPFVLIPYAIAMTVAAFNTHPFAAPVWFFLAGASFGCMTVAMSSLWAEAFGIESLGAISSLVGATGVFASALSPFLFGWLLDHGLNIDHLFLSGAFLTIGVSFLGLIAPAPKKHT